FEKFRKDFEYKVDDAINRAKINGSVDAALMKDLLDDLRGLHDTLERSVADLSPGQYIEGKRYLNLLDDALRALQDPNVKNFFNRTHEARGKTVGDLVDYMAKNGLTF